MTFDGARKSFRINYIMFLEPSAGLRFIPKDGVVGVECRAPKAGALRPVSEPKGMLAV
jgi:hypothetical protein